MLIAGRARVTSQPALAAARAQMKWADLQGERAYKPWTAYNQSKLATMLFGLQLDRRSSAHGWEVTSNVAHPALTRTNLQASGPTTGGGGPQFDAMFRLLAPIGWPVQQVEGVCALPCTR